MLVWETAEQTMSGEAELEFARIWRQIPKVVFSRTLNSAAGNARLATDVVLVVVGGEAESATCWNLVAARCVRRMGWTALPHRSQKFP
jgi:hypothetical protein